MADTNGNVAEAHLTTYQGVLVSSAILPDLRAAGTEFRQRGYTFGIILPDGGYRSLATQEDEHLHPAAHNISAAMAKRLAAVGKSSHGFGRAVDVTSNATPAVIAEIMTKHGFHHPYTWDPPHWEWGNALTAADISVTPLPTVKEEDMDYDYIYDGAGNYAICHPVHIVGGYIATKTKATAEGWNLVTGLAARKVEPADWARTLAAAKALADAAVAARPAASASDDSKVLAELQKINAALTGLKAPTKFTGTLA